MPALPFVAASIPVAQSSFQHLVGDIVVCVCVCVCVCCEVETNVTLDLRGGISPGSFAFIYQKRKKALSGETIHTLAAYFQGEAIESRLHRAWELSTSSNKKAAPFKCGWVTRTQLPCTPVSFVRCSRFGRPGCVSVVAPGPHSGHTLRWLAVYQLRSSVASGRVPVSTGARRLFTNTLHH